MSTTDKYDMDLTDYGTTGWNAILKGDIEKLDDFLHSRILGTLGETVAAYEPVYLKSDGKYWKAQSAAGKLPCAGLAIEAGNADDQIRIIRLGPITNGSWSWTVPDKVYISNTAGGLTQNRPSAFAQAIGRPLTTTSLFVWVEDMIPVHYGQGSPPTPTDYEEGIVYFQLQTTTSTTTTV